MIQQRTEENDKRDGLTQQQVAEALGVSPRQAKRIEAKALKKLAELAQQQGIKEEDLR